MDFASICWLICKICVAVLVLWFGFIGGAVLYKKIKRPRATEKKND